ncbi:MAG: hypothetical protein ACREAC_10710, partial [Blastocatellia bacterium]
MSANEQAIAAPRRMNPYWSMRIRQFKAIVRMEISKNFLGRRAILLYLMALAPIGVVSLFAIQATLTRQAVRAGELNVIFAGIFQALIVRNVVFFGCAWMFMNLFRGDIVDKSLHYYFLVPARREVVVTGKYVAGLIASAVLFGLTTIFSVALLVATAKYLVGGGDSAAVVSVAQALKYLSITALACAAYGGVFLLVGLFFRNPIIPALVLYGWEWINFLLPPVLKRISVVHYIDSLSPVPLSQGPLALVGEPTAAWLSII